MKNSLILLICFFFLLGCSSVKLKKSLPISSKGKLEISNWDFEKDGIVKLNGEWEFYWNELKAPEKFNEVSLPADTQYFDIPRKWNGFKSKGVEISGHGFATFRLIVKVDPSIEFLALRSLEMSSAYKMWANSKLVLSNGTVGKSIETEVPEYLSKTAIVRPEKGIIELVLQVSNFNYKRGGPWNEIELGTTEAINKEKEENLVIDFLLFGAIIIMACYHFGLFLLRRKDRSPLYFGLLCFLVALRVLVTGERLMHEYASWIGWEMLVRLEFVTFYLATPVFLVFLGNLFSELSRISVKLIVTICLLFTANVLVTGPIHFSSTLPYFQAFILILCPYIIFCFILAILHKKEGALLVALGSMIMILSLVYDIFEAKLYFTGITIAPLGVFVFIFIQSFMLSKRFSGAFTMVEELSANLEQKVERRTSRLKKAKEELEQSNQKLKETQSQLVQSQKMEAMGTMAGGIAHEFNNILGSILGFAELLKLDLPPENNEYQWAQEIVKSGDRASNLVQQILTFSRADSRKLIPVSMQDELKDIQNLINISLAKSINLTVRLDLNCRPILANKTQISQILVNLCKNAEYAILPSEGTIIIELKEKTFQKGFFADSPESEGDYIQLIVEDTGTGIPEHEISRIFDPFYTTKEVNEGTGLGLSIVHGIVKNHYGHIKVESEVGKGTRFMVYFPVTDNKIIDTKSKDEDLRPGKGHILLVEDDLQLASFYRMILTKTGYKVTQQDNGYSALETFKKEPDAYDLVLTDQAMPQMSGLDLSKEISKICPEIPIVMSTGNKNLVSEADARQQGIKSILTKPVRISALTTVIAELLDS